jgi:hypothetical protein
MYRLRKSIGYSDIPYSDYLVRIKKPRLQIKTAFRTCIETVLFAWQRFFPMRRIGNEVNIKEIDRFDESIDKTGAFLEQNSRIRLKKDHEYLNWRYFNCPGKQYKIYCAEGMHPAAIILNVSGDDGDEGWIVDLICRTEEYPLIQALINTAVKFFKEIDVKRIYVFCTSQLFRKFFYKFGFLPTGKTPHFTFIANSKLIAPEVLDSLEWNFWHGDGDIELYA